jgi:hypothetical protein
MLKHSFAFKEIHVPRGSATPILGLPDDKKIGYTPIVGHLYSEPPFPPMVTVTVTTEYDNFTAIRDVSIPTTREFVDELIKVMQKASRIARSNIEEVTK